MERRTAIGQQVWDLPALDVAENMCVQQFMDSSLRLFATLNDGLISAHGLSLFAVLVLELLARSASGSARMRDLAEAFALAPSRVTQLIDRLEAQGLVGRNQHPQGRRVVLATITGEGRARLQSAIVTYARVVRLNYLDRLSRQQAIALGDACRRTGLPTRPA